MKAGYFNNGVRTQQSKQLCNGSNEDDKRYRVAQCYFRKVSTGRDKYSCLLRSERYYLRLFDDSKAPAIAVNASAMPTGAVIDILTRFDQCVFPNSQCFKISKGTHLLSQSIIADDFNHCCSGLMHESIQGRPCLMSPISKSRRS